MPRSEFYNRTIMDAHTEQAAIRAGPRCVLVLYVLSVTSHHPFIPSLSLKHSQLVLGRGIHPVLLHPFFSFLLSQLLSLPLSLPLLNAPPLPPPFSSSYLSLPSTVISPLSRLDVVDWACAAACTQRMACCSGAGGRLGEPVKQATGSFYLPRQQDVLLE